MKTLRLFFKKISYSNRVFKDRTRKRGFHWAITASIGALLLSGSGIVLANDQFPETHASVQDLIKAGYKSNPEIQAAYSRWEASRERIHARRTLPDPAVGYTYYLESVETRVGPQEGAASVTQRLPWLGKLRLEGRIAEKQAAAARYHYEATVQRVAAEIEEAYWDYLYLLKAITTTEQNLELLRNWEKVAMSKYTTARAGHPDIIKAQVEVLALEDRLASLQQMQIPVVQRLSAAVGVPLTVESIGVNPIPIQELPVAEENLPNELLTRNPSLAAERAMIEAAELGLRRSRLNYRPDFMVGGKVVFTGENPALGNDPENGKDPIMFTLGLSIPIHLKKYRSLEQASRAEWKSAELTTRNLENKFLAQLERTVFEFQDAARKIRLYEEALIPRAEQALVASEAAYVSDRVDFLTLIETHRALLDYQLSYQKALADQAGHHARLSALLGRYTGNDLSSEEN
ncbi:MAG: TolC family protein [Fidelibacterota bacterium]|nr:MAG: TolC family protein [Candidatus Neomarinimicrobiota bacterium]